MSEEFSGQMTRSRSSCRSARRSVPTTWLSRTLRRSALKSRRRATGDDDEDERHRDEGDRERDERRSPDRGPPGEGSVRLAEGDAGPREAAVGQRAPHPLLEHPHHGDEQRGRQRVPAAQQGPLHRGEDRAHRGDVEGLGDGQGHPREGPDEDARPAEGGDEAAEPRDEPEQRTHARGDVPHGDADERHPDDRHEGQVVVREGEPQAQAPDEGQGQTYREPRDHSHGVESTTVVRVETPPRLRTVASSSSRSCGVPTRTRRR